MTSLHNSLKFKLWRRRLSICAPQMNIRSALPWPFKAFGGLALVLLVGVVCLWIYNVDHGLSGFNLDPTKQQLAAFKEQINKLGAERDEFSTTVNAAESQINMERSAQKQLAMQVQALEQENNKLKEDLAFFESLPGAAGGGFGISIRRFQTEVVAPNQLRYRLLVMQGGKVARDFVGNVQFSVTTLQDGKSAIMNFPETPAADSVESDNFKLNFRNYQRVDGVLTVPEGVAIKAVQVRVLEKGKIRAQQSTNL